MRSRKVSKSRDQVLKCTYHFKIWQAHQQHCCRGTCQISVQYQTIVIYKFWGFETLRDLIVRRLIGYWNMSQGQCPIRSLIVGSHCKVPKLREYCTQRARDAIITSLWSQNEVVTSFWCHNDFIIASRTRWVPSLWNLTGTLAIILAVLPTRAEVPVRFQSNAVDFDVLPNQHVNHASYPLSKKKKDKLFIFVIFNFGFVSTI